MNKEFNIFGPIRRIRVVVDKRTGKPRGYAFIEYENKRDFDCIYYPIIINISFIAALVKGEGRRVDGRRVKVDYERGRTKSDWIPRRLGGGKGDTRRDRTEEKIIRDLKKSHPLLRPKSRSRSKDMQR